MQKKYDQKGVYDVVDNYRKNQYVPVIRAVMKGEPKANEMAEYIHDWVRYPYPCMCLGDAYMMLLLSLLVWWAMMRLYIYHIPCSYVLYVMTCMHVMLCSIYDLYVIFGGILMFDVSFDAYLCVSCCMLLL